MQASQNHVHSRTASSTAFPPTTTHQKPPGAVLKVTSTVTPASFGPGAPASEKKGAAVETKKGEKTPAVIKPTKAQEDLTKRVLFKAAQTR